MKSLILLLLLPFTLFAQRIDTTLNLKVSKYFTRPACIKYSVCFNAGIIQGSQEASETHYDIFKRVHGIPDKLDRYFNFNVSWREKYKNGDPLQGEAFPGSTGVFAPFTDYYHGSKAMFISMMAIGFTINIGQKQKLKDILIESAI